MEEQIELNGGNVVKFGDNFTWEEKKQIVEKATKWEVKPFSGQFVYYARRTRGGFRFSNVASFQWRKPCPQ